MERILHIQGTIEKIESALENKLVHTEDPGFLASSHMIELISRTPIDILLLTHYESNVCTSGGCSLKIGHYNLLEEAGVKLDQLDLEIKKGAMIDRALENVPDASRIEFEDAEAYS